MDQHYQGAPGPDPMIGQTIGNYLVRQKLGEGGMGSVYMAEHPHIGKKVALKVLHPELAASIGPGVRPSQTPARARRPPIASCHARAGSR